MSLDPIFTQTVTWPVERQWDGRAKSPIRPSRARKSCLFL
jgi:hypothetical protein